MKIAINKTLISNNENKINDSIIIFDGKYNNIGNKNTIFLFSTIKDAQYFLAKKNIVPNYNEDYIMVKYWNFGINEFLPAIQNEYINFDGIYKQVCQLNKNDIGKFCRSNSGNKLWSGQILDESLINIIKNKLQPDDLMYISDAKKFTGYEYRCWVINEKIIEITPYNRFMEDNLHHEKSYDEIKEYVEKINLCWTPDDMFVIDICVYKNKPYVVEYNCFSTSGFYNADVNKICNEVIKYYEK